MLPLALAVATVVATPVERTNGVISKNFQHDYELTGNDHFIPVNRGNLLLLPHPYHLINTDERRVLVKRSPLVNIISHAPDQDDGSVEDGLEIGEVVEQRHLEKRSPKKPPFDPFSKKKIGKKVAIFGKKGIFGKKKKGIVKKTVVTKGKPIAKKGVKTAGKTFAFQQAAPLLPAIPAIPAIGLGGPALGLGGGALAFGIPGTGFEGFVG